MEEDTRGLTESQSSVVLQFVNLQPRFEVRFSRFDLTHDAIQRSHNIGMPLLHFAAQGTRKKRAGRFWL